MHKFSRKSLENLKSCHPILWELAHEVMELQLFDFGISCGHRGETEQDALYFSGKSKVKFPNSKHNANPSKAFDFFILVNGKINWDDSAAWYMAVGVFRGVAAKLGMKIRVGADWDGDFTARDQSFHDICHIEILEK